MNKHTPGPWFADLSAETVTGADGNTVVYELNTNEADARLIAAAPDLLEALKNLVNQHNTVYGIGDMEMQSAIDFAHKAIAKAKGEKP